MERDTILLVKAGRNAGPRGGCWRSSNWCRGQGGPIMKVKVRGHHVVHLASTSTSTSTNNATKHGYEFDNPVCGDSDVPGLVDLPIPCSAVDGVSLRGLFQLGAR